MIRSTDIEDTYKGGAFLRVWSVSSSGQAICAVDAHATADVEQATLDATTASNAKIRTALAEVDAVESASRISEPKAEVPKTVTSTDMEGNESTEAHPSWAAYDAAQATISGASEATNQFVTVRSLGVQTETLPKTETTTEPILNEDGTDSGETREVVTVVAGETIVNPDYAAWKAAWDAVDADLN
tara:strand:+ start:3694 stop:4251 length:558 start_codon:yes stop_codon:yes gene_type:complete